MSSLISSGLKQGLPRTVLLMPSFSYSSEKVIPDWPFFKFSATSSRVLPRQLVMPMPVTTTRRSAWHTVVARCRRCLAVAATAVAAAASASEGQAHPKEGELASFGWEARPPLLGCRVSMGRFKTPVKAWPRKMAVATTSTEQDTRMMKRRCLKTPEDAPQVLSQSLNQSLTDPTSAPPKKSGICNTKCM